MNSISIQRWYSEQLLCTEYSSGTRVPRGANQLDACLHQSVLFEKEENVSPCTDFSKLSSFFIWTKALTLYSVYLTFFLWNALCYKKMAGSPLQIPHLGSTNMQ